jgi:hypothetical protein
LTALYFGVLKTKPNFHQMVAEEGGDEVFVVFKIDGARDGCDAETAGIHGADGAQTERGGVF